MKIEKIESVLEPGNNIFILMVEEPKTTKVYTRIMSRSFSIECNKPREYGTDYPVWISTRISESGYTVEDGGIDLLYAKTGPNLSIIHSELNKLYLMKQDTKAILCKDIELYVSLTRTSGAFDVFDCLIRKDLGKLLASFESFCRVSDEYTDLVHLFAKNLEKLYRMLILKDQKTDPEMIAALIGMPPFIVKTKYLPRALALGKSWLVSMLEKTCALEVALRTFKGDKKAIMYQYFFLSV